MRRKTYTLLLSLAEQVAALSGGLPSTGLPVPDAPVVAALDQDSLAGQFQFPAGTTIDQLEIDVTPLVS
jgi:phosphoribosylcarboxyaminoimidazole (NCAIR) mutase